MECRACFGLFSFALGKQALWYICSMLLPGTGPVQSILASDYLCEQSLSASSCPFVDIYGTALSSIESEQAS